MGVKELARTPPGQEVKLTYRAWEHIIRQHPEMTNYQDAVAQAIRAPDEVYEGSRDELALLKRQAIRLGGKNLYVVVYYTSSDGDALVVTAHPMSNKSVRRKFRKWRRW